MLHRGPEAAARDSNLDPHRRLRRLPRAGEYARRHQRQRLQSHRDSRRNTSRPYLRALLLPDTATSILLPELWHALRIHTNDQRRLPRRIIHSKSAVRLDSQRLQATVDRSSSRTKQKRIRNASASSSRHKQATRQSTGAYASWITSGSASSGRT